MIHGSSLRLLQSIAASFGVWGYRNRFLRSIMNVVPRSWHHSSQKKISKPQLKFPLRHRHIPAEYILLHPPSYGNFRRIRFKIKVRMILLYFFGENYHTFYILLAPSFFHHKWQCIVITCTTNIILLCFETQVYIYDLDRRHIWWFYWVKIVFSTYSQHMWIPIFRHFSHRFFVFNGQVIVREG